jgi:hypothetical protein
MSLERRERSLTVHIGETKRRPAHPCTFQNPHL